MLRKNSPPALPCPGHRSTDTREAIHGCLGVCAPKIVFCEEGAVTEVTHGGFRLGAGIAFHGRWDSPNGASLAIAIGTVPMASPTLARLQVAYEPHEGAANLFSVTPRYRVLCVSLQSSLAGRYAISLQMHDQWSSPTWLQCPAPHCRWDSPNATETSTAAQSNKAGAEPLGQSQWQAAAKYMRMMRHRSDASCALPSPLTVGTVPTVAGVFEQHGRMKDLAERERSRLIDSDRASTTHLPLGQSQWLAGISMIHGIKAFNRRAVGAAFRVAALHVPRTASCWGRPYHQRGNQMKPDPQ